MFGRNGEHMVDAKAMKFRDFGRLLLRIDFIDDDKHGLAGPSQQPDKFLIGRCDAGSAVGDEENEYCSFNRYLRLFVYANRDLALFARNNAAGVDNFVAAAMPIEDAVDSIPGDSRLVRND